EESERSRHSPSLDAAAAPWTAPGSCCLPPAAGVDGVLTSQLPAPNPPEPSCVLQLGVLQEALEKLQKKRVPPWGKKLGPVPALCAVRKASRIGKLCNCPRGASCNFFLLKCL
uniref:Cocaine- and amphetamine-regulated transcript protein n=1 Tax=Chelydra serpentina TaxID=8475 RepID=A0A8C3RP98_CHESE